MVTDEQLSVRSRFKDLMENTSAHGLGSIDRAGKCGVRKLFWSVVFSFALGMFLLQLYWIGVEYINKDVSISVDIRYSRRLHFPAITVCNLNPIKMSALHRSAALNSLLSSESETVAPSAQAPSSTLVSATSLFTVTGGTTKDFGGTTDREVQPPAGTPKGSGPPPPGRKKRTAEEDKKDPGYGDWSGVNYGEKSEKLNLFLQVTDAVASVPYDQREALGHDIWDMLLSCSWKGLPCSPERQLGVGLLPSVQLHRRARQVAFKIRNFTHFFNYKHGNCYTFNSGKTRSVEMSSKPGPLYGLTLELFLQQSEYIPDVQQAAGMRVSIHDQGTMPFPEDNGVSIQPGTETSVGVRNVRITREPEPYGDCVSPSADELTDNIFTKFFNTSYTLESCEKNCLFYRILEACHCADPRFRYDEEYPPCLSTNTSQVACQEEVELAYVSEELNCPCANPCNERVFETTISSASWPNDQYKRTVISQLSAISDKIRLQIIEDEDFVQKNVLKLHVYFEHLNYESIVQSPAYTELDCLSDIGGQIGLWIGFSVITWFEMGEFIVDVFIILCKKMAKVGQQRQTTPMDLDLFHSEEKKMAFEMNREMTVSDIKVS